MRTVETNRCIHCSKRHNDALSAKVCCLFAPSKPTGECAWCGDDLPEGSFCNQACAISYRDDVITEAQKYWRAHAATETKRRAGNAR